jgi:beta-phosphoglucomutase-like phosphatase (HAD superfamily)
MQRSVFDAAIFDMDGVVTRTTDLHAAAWKELFDAYLRQRQSRSEPAQPPCRGFRLCRGYVAQELSHLIEHERVNLLVVGWHGQFMTGHAEVLKTLIWQTRCAVLLVKPRPRDVFRLKVGDALV